ncbi:unnamed protein product [Miscanthus lutarioriparius]|uniref:F-box domain-containing protein n=1 Tax=Miscanthus lutarioriparius TaxID=422564 RepID=A0A811PXX0_9POAL|nr:unnamed protein product [Miscanthus lutarioriparius]
MEGMDLTPPLPDDVLAGVLRRLAPRGLAVSRCVCKAWRRVVDDRRHLRADLLPRSLGGIFLNLHDLRFTQFLSRPTTGAAVSGRLDYTVPGEPDRLPPIYVKDHCNGLLLLHHCVVNPATRQWVPLPPRSPLPQPPPPGMSVCTKEYLVFDPTMSLNYELLIVPDVPYKLNDDNESIRLPTELTEDENFYLGKSINGIYCASIFQGSQLQVWFVNDQCVHGQTEWVLKHGRDIFPILPNLNYDEQCDGAWILQEFYCWGQEHSDDEAYTVAYCNEAILEEKFVWDSDNDNVLEPGSRSKDSFLDFLGFHPYKEVVFLSDKFDRVLAYNWSISKIQDLGKVFPKFYIDWDLHFHHKYVSASFPYTPCSLGELPEKLNLEAQLED